MVYSQVAFSSLRYECNTQNNPPLLTAVASCWHPVRTVGADNTGLSILMLACVTNHLITRNLLLPVIHV